MFFPPNLGPQFVAVIDPIMKSDAPDHIRMMNAWSMLNGLQGVVLSQMIRNRMGENVLAGPFSGMRLTKEALSGHFAPALLGSYEWELHDTIEKVIAHQYKQVLNIGCSYGYYSVGLAKRMPEAKVMAFDIDPIARVKCGSMIAANGVEGRVTVGERFNGEDFARLSGPETLVIMDIEGGEMDLLNVESYPALKGMDVIVELHDCYNPAISKTIADRFSATHKVEIIPNRPFHFPLEKILGPDYVPNHFDGLIATWEGRSGPTPWAVMRRR